MAQESPDEQPGGNDEEEVAMGLHVVKPAENDTAENDTADKYGAAK